MCADDNCTFLVKALKLVNGRCCITEVNLAHKCTESSGKNAIPSYVKEGWRGYLYQPRVKKKTAVLQQLVHKIQERVPETTTGKVTNVTNHGQSPANTTILNAIPVQVNAFLVPGGVFETYDHIIAKVYHTLFAMGKSYVVRLRNKYGLKLTCPDTSCSFMLKATRRCRGLGLCHILQVNLHHTCTKSSGTRMAVRKDVLKRLRGCCSLTLVSTARKQVKKKKKKVNKPIPTHTNNVVTQALVSINTVSTACSANGTKTNYANTHTHSSSSSSANSGARQTSNSTVKRKKKRRRTGSVLEPKPKHKKRKKQASPPRSYYDVEKILNQRIDSEGRKSYLVKWVNYEDDCNSWEPLVHVQNCLALKDFLTKRAEQ